MLKHHIIWWFCIKHPLSSCVGWEMCGRLVHFSRECLRCWNEICISIFPCLMKRKHLFLTNSTTQFTVELPSTLFLYGGWEIAVLEFSCKFTSGIKYGDSLQIYCYVIDLSPVRGIWEPLLRNILFDRPMRTPVALLDFRYVRVAHTSIKWVVFKLELHNLKLWLMNMLQISFYYIWEVVIIDMNKAYSTVENSLKNWIN